MAEQTKKAKKTELTTAEFVKMVNHKGEDRNGTRKKSSTRTRRVH